VKAEQGFRLIMNRGLLGQVGGVQVDYLSGPLRRGFNVKTTSQAGTNSCGSCSC